ncbi:uncharacterized protein LOC106666040 isoform X2 [Cimex lectularius]|uniref:Uncharacterized protein n=1 Tax=Cimex lectularius TaxID=79782 RepID=A0A8I6RQW1_CIMLE|nr:uncharacterized protein LOC106666040 isoform X2 [Cimex lectularius]
MKPGVNQIDQISHFTTIWVWMLHFTEQFCNYGILTYLYYGLRALQVNSDLSMLCVHSYIFLGLVAQCTFRFLPYRPHYIFRAVLVIYIFGLISTILLITQFIYNSSGSPVHYIIWPSFMHAITSGGAVELIRVIVKFNYHKEQENRKVAFMFRMTEYLGQLYAVIQVSWFDDKRKTANFDRLSLHFLLVSKVIGFLSHKIDTVQHETNILLKLMSFYCSNLKNWILHISERKNIASKKEFKIKDSSSMVSQTIYTLPAFFPLILVMYYFDFKFSKYLRQSEHLRNEFFEGERFHHNAILTVLPAMKILSLPLFIFIIIPMYEKYSKKVFTSFKQYLWSCFFLLLSIVCACITESHLNTDPRYHQHTALVQIFNGVLDTVLIHFSGHNQISLFIQPISVENIAYDYSLPPTLYLQTYHMGQHKSTSLPLTINKHAISIYLIKLKQSNEKHLLMLHLDTVSFAKSAIFNETTQLPSLRVVYDLKSKKTKVEIIGPTIISLTLNNKEHITHVFILKPGRYVFKVNDEDSIVPSVLEIGGVYTFLLVQPKSFIPVGALLTTREPFRRKIVFQTPQYAMLAIAEMIIESPSFIYFKEMVMPKYYEILSLFWCLTNCLSQIFFIFTLLAITSHTDLYLYIADIIILTTSTMLLIVMYKTCYKPNTDKFKEHAKNEVNRRGREMKRPN